MKIKAQIKALELRIASTPDKVIVKYDDLAGGKYRITVSDKQGYGIHHLHEPNTKYPSAKDADRVAKDLAEELGFKKRKESSDPMGRPIITYS